MNKQCTQCKLTKDISAFYIRKKGIRKGKPRASCILCDKQYRIAHKYTTIAKWKEKNPDYDRRRDLKRKFNITLEKYNDILQLQNNKCAICGKDASTFKVNLSVDHNHTTNKVRGLLYIDCNFGLGQFKDSITNLNNAITYLQKHE
jgi:hypothetical protein